MDDVTPEANEGLFGQVSALRAAVVAEAVPILGRFGALNTTNAALENLAHYLALRHRDLRGLQRDLMWRGLSSLGRLESRVLPTLDAVLAAAAALEGRGDRPAAPAKDAFFAGEARLADASNRLFGASPQGRRSRIMVTLPTEAGESPAYTAELARLGMDVARINCAHDDSTVWSQMVRNVRAAGEVAGRPIRILMDIAGPKIRTAAVAARISGARLRAGDAFLLVSGGPPRVTDAVQFAAVIATPGVVESLSAGQRLRYDDGKLDGVVERTEAGQALVRVVRTKRDGVRLKPEKGLNFPDTLLDISPLTDKDERDLSAIAELADIVGYSFVSRHEHVDLLEAILDRRGAAADQIGLIAKIELPEAVKNLPELIARATRNRPFGVMIARGDLAAEIGFERLAEMQEEILWICEAASVPAIWATQVLEDLVRDGIPSRGEMTDAAMASRAECVMLNKGPFVGMAIQTLDRLLSRMDAHMFKKTATLRELFSW